MIRKVDFYLNRTGEGEKKGTLDYEGGGQVHQYNLFGGQFVNTSENYKSMAPLTWESLQVEAHM